MRGPTYMSATRVRSMKCLFFTPKKLTRFTRERWIKNGHVGSRRSVKGGYGNFFFSKFERDKTEINTGRGDRTEQRE